MKKQVITSIALIVFSLSLTAQIAPGFNFQGVARNASGELLKDQSIDVVVGIRSGSASGSLVWEEEHTSSTNDFGLFTLTICGDNSLRSGGSADNLDDIDWAADNHYIDLQIDAGQGMVDLGASQLLSVPYSMVTNSLPNSIAEIEVQPQEAPGPGEALFMVKRADGYPVFAVYEDGVWVYTDDDAEGKGIKGGFAVGGYNTANKAPAEEYFMVSPDSARIYVNSFDGKGIKGGFAVGGYNTANKGNLDEFFRVTRDSTRVYVNSELEKGIKGGFAVGGYNTSNKTGNGSFMSLDRDNYFIGQSSGTNITSGLYNSVMGYESGYNITSGESNAFLGYQAGYFNREGSGNLFLGYQSGYSNWIGNYNTFLGYQAGFKNFGGTNNTFLGSFTGHDNIGGSYNTFIGDSTGYKTTYGGHNTFIGTKAGLNNTTGYSNVFIGNDAGSTNDNGMENVFIGRQSGLKTETASRNVFIGVESGYSDVSGWDNIFVGTAAGRSLTEGAGNVFLGYESGRNMITGTRNVFIGNTAGYNEQGSDKLFITNWPSDSTETLIWGDFMNRRLRLNGKVGVGMHPETDDISVYNPIGMGVLSLYGYGNGYDYSSLLLKADTLGPEKYYNLAHTMGNDFFLGYFNEGNIYPRLLINSAGKVGINGWPGHQNLTIHDENDIADIIIKGAGNPYDYATVILESVGQTRSKNYAISHNKSNGMSFIYYDGTGYFPRMMIDSLGHVALNNWEAGTEILDVNGNARIRGVPSGSGTDLMIQGNGTLVRSASDVRMKSDLQPLVNSLEKVLLMDGYTFTWKDDEYQDRDAGMIAQEVAEIFPEAVFENPNDGYMGINYSRFPALFVEAFKEQQSIIEEQQSEIDDLNARLKLLEELILDNH